MTDEEWAELYEMSVPASHKMRHPRFCELLAKTSLVQEHPEDYEGPCNCALCQSYADVEE